MNQRGNAILLVLMGSGIMSVVALGISSLTLNSQSSIDTAKSLSGRMSLQQDLKTIISDQTVCGNKLSIRNPGQIASGAVTLSATLNGKSIGSDNQAARELYDLDNVSIQIKNIVANGNDPISGLRQYQGSLELSAEKKNSSVGGKSLQDMVIGPISFSVTAANQISSCASASVGSSVSVVALCSQLGGVYTAGANPPCRVAPQCPAGQLMISQGPGQPGVCQAPPVQIVTQTITIREPAYVPPPPPPVVEPVYVPPTVVSEPVYVPPTPAPTPTAPAKPAPGTITGGGYCTEYPKHDPVCANAGCGDPSNLKCPPTWQFWGTGQFGGCASGNSVSAAVKSNYNLTNNNNTGYSCIAN